MAITLASTYTEVKDFGPTLELSSCHMDHKGQKLILVFETKDTLDAWTGKQLLLTVTTTGSTAVKLDGTVVNLPGLVFSDLSVQACYGGASCDALVTDNNLQE